MSGSELNKIDDVLKIMLIGCIELIVFVAVYVQYGNYFAISYDGNDDFRF